MDLRADSRGYAFKRYAGRLPSEHLVVRTDLWKLDRLPDKLHMGFHNSSAIDREIMMRIRTEVIVLTAAAMLAAACSKTPEPSPREGSDIKVPVGIGPTPNEGRLLLAAPPREPNRNVAAGGNSTELPAKAPKDKIVEMAKAWVASESAEIKPELVGKADVLARYGMDFSYAVDSANVYVVVYEDQAACERFGSKLGATKKRTKPCTGVRLYFSEDGHRLGLQTF